MKALASPLRLRILRLCLDHALTNKELADELGMDPGSVLYHVRVLVRTGFLAPEPVRRGNRGAIERPYRATGKSWTLEMNGEPRSQLAIVDAFRAELADGRPGDVLIMSRLGVRLRADDLRELMERLTAIGMEFRERDDRRGGPVGLLVGLHRRRVPRRRVGGGA